MADDREDRIPAQDETPRKAAWEAPRQWLRSKIVEVGANLVVLDSLRRLMPSKAENDSDDMAPAIASVAKLARDTQAAILLVHHKGDSDKFFRGSTAIRDQADALFALLREGQADDDEGEDDGVRRLRCRGGKGKMRYAPEPPDVFLTISPADGGVATCDAPAPRARSQAPTLAAVKRAILSALPTKTKTAAAGKVGRRDDDPTFRAAWAALEDDGAIAKQDGRWNVVVVQTPREPPPQLSEPTVSSLRLGATDGRLGGHSTRLAARAIDHVGGVSPGRVEVDVCERRLDVGEDRFVSLIEAHRPLGLELRLALGEPFEPVVGNRLPVRRVGDVGAPARTLARVAVEAAHAHAYLRTVVWVATEEVCPAFATEALLKSAGRDDVLARAATTPTPA